jgi:ATP phosphoribosyltransferase
LIVDITTTGATLQANALKVLDDGVMLKSEANLVASLSASWTATQRRLAHSMLARIAAEEEARRNRAVRAAFRNVPATLAAEAMTRFGVVVVASQDDEIAFHCPKKKIFDVSEWLIASGAARVSVAQLDYVFTSTNALADRLDKRLGA